MSRWNEVEKHIPILVGALLRDAPIRPIISILHNGQDFALEDQGTRDMAEKIKETEIEISHAPAR